jgi:type IV fimbrial biogenesis protein FimT
MQKGSRGFTIMELMVVLSIAGVIIALGAPSFTRFQLNNRLTNSANDLLATLVQARTEAITRQVNVSWCTSATPGVDTASCAASNAGWIAFVDTNRNCLRDTGEIFLGGRQLDHSMSQHPLTFVSNGDCLSYAPTGFLQDISGRVTATHTLFCDERGTAQLAGTNMSAGRGLVVARTGRAKITRLITGGSSEDITTWTSAPVSLSCP